MRLALAPRALRGSSLPRFVAALLVVLSVVLVPVGSLVAQGGATSHTVRNATGSFLQALLQVAIPVVIVAAAVYILMSHRRRRG